MEKQRIILRRDFFAKVTALCGAGAGAIGALPLTGSWLRTRRSEKTLAQLTCADFRPAVGSRFRVVSSDGQCVSMLLFKAEERTRHRLPAQAGTREFRTPFSLVFKAASECAFAQGTYRVEHPRLGAVPLFLVAVGAPRGGVSTFEAVFG